MATSQPPRPEHRHEPDEFEQEVAPPPETALAKSEINQQVATAKHYPRSIKKFKDEALQLATLDEETAAACIYALPRDGKTIEGPSARFAEIIGYSWGNARIASRVIGEDEDFVTTQGMFYDLERNVAKACEVKRRITDRNGRRYSSDMITMTANAASSIAERNVVLRGIPKALWNPIYKAARSVVAGDIRTLANRRAEAIKQFAIFGVKPEDIFRTLDVKGVEDITIEHLVTLRGILTAIQEESTTPEQAFAPPATQDGNLASKSADGLKAIKERHAQRQQNGGNGKHAPADGVAVDFAR